MTLKNILTLNWHATQTALGHYQQSSFTNPMLITALQLFWSECHREPRNEVGSLSLAVGPMEFETGTFWFWLSCPNLLGHSSLLTYPTNIKLCRIYIKTLCHNYITILPSFFFITLSSHSRQFSVTFILSKLHSMQSLYLIQTYCCKSCYAVMLY